MVRHRFLTSPSARPTRLRAGVAATVVGLLLVVAGCSSITTSRTAISDAGAPLTAALQQLRKDNQAGIEQGSTTVGDATHCFYQLPHADAEDVTNEVACGPIRRLGQPKERVWDVYRLIYTEKADGQLTGAVDKRWQRAITVDPALLVAPDDTEPANADQVPEPQAPPSTVTNAATMLAEKSTGAQTLGKLTKLKKPVRLLTPSASIEVTAMSKTPVLPADAVQKKEEDDGPPTPVYRPADGQTAYALQVTVGPGTDGSKLLSTSSDEPLSSWATALSIKAGEETVAITDDSTIPQDPDADTLTVPCQNERKGQTEGKASYPCTSERSDGGVLVMTVPADSEPTLVATAGEASQSVQLPDGALSSEVSQVEYDRSTDPVKIGKELQNGPMKATSEDTGKKKDKGKKDKKKSKISSSWQFDVDAAGLSAFDPYRGWAPADKAWLVVSTSGYQQSGDGHEAWKTDRVASIGLEVDGKRVGPDGLTEVDGTDDVTWVFAVPADLETAELTFKPTGVYTGGKKDKDFSTKSAKSLKLTFKK